MCDKQNPLKHPIFHAICNAKNVSDIKLRIYRTLWIPDKNETERCYYLLEHTFTHIKQNAHLLHGRTHVRSMLAARETMDKQPTALHRLFERLRGTAKF